MKLNHVFVLALLVAGQGILSGCVGEPTMPETELKAKTDLNSIARRAFQSGQTWETLPEQDRQAYISLYKEEAKAKEMFNKALEGMRYFFQGGGTPGGGVNPGAPSQAPGGGAQGSEQSGA